MKRPDEVVIISGKGGTGKTSVASALLYYFGERAMGADCDVDGSNFPILFDPHVENSIPFYSGEEAHIDPYTCISCGACQVVCKFDALTPTSQPEVISRNCEGCGYCARVCPQNAITMENRLSGTVKTSTIRTGTHMVHGDLVVGGENSGKLVAKVREIAHNCAEQHQIPLIITDGSPGIGCPVVSSLSGAGFALLVTEPTLSGIHDLERIATIINTFKIPAGIVINKVDLNRRNRDRLHLLSRNKGIPVIGEIPYSRSFGAALQDLRTVMELPQSPLPRIITGIANTVMEHFHTP